MEVLQVKNISKQYGTKEHAVQALKDVTFSVSKGEFVAIVGTSGSGKSTLLHLIGGLDVPSKGDIFIRSHHTAGLNRKELTIFRRRNIGFVFQNYSLMPVLNVYDNVALPVTFDKGRHVDHNWIEELLKELGLWEKRKRFPQELSGGQQQRVALIMTNEQMEQYFGISDYRTISISLQQFKDADTVSATLGKLTASLGSCAVKDYTGQIRIQNRYLSQKMFFYYGIAAILLGISLLHIMNSMQYLVLTRKREFGILRAMGITDAGFRRLLAKEGLRYGIYSVLIVLGVYFAVQKVLYYFMIRVYLYLHPKWCISWQALAGVAAADVILCVGVVLAAGETVLREQIMDEIRE